MVGQKDLALFCRVRRRLCALPVDCVSEVMRALPISNLEGAPAVVLGLAVIRGAPVPVVDAGSMLGAGRSRNGYFVSAGPPERRFALVVDGVLGLRALAPTDGDAGLPLLEAAGADVVSSVRALGEEILFVLRATRIVPPATWKLMAT